jgi:uncharacterized membrane protein YtjA (UPF0391 family)
MQDCYPARSPSAAGALIASPSGVRETSICDRKKPDRPLTFPPSQSIVTEWIPVMLRLALFFLVISLIAALFGFGGIAAAAADIARILFFIFIVIFLALLVAGLMAGSTLF